MLRKSLLLAFVCCPLSAFAGGPPVNVEILSPVVGTCVNNGGEVFLGGIVGGEAAQPTRPVSTRIRLIEQNGNGRPDPITLTFSVDQVEQFVAVYTPVAEGQAEETDLYSLFAIQDGPQRTLTVSAALGGGASVTDSVSFRLDRAAPAFRTMGELPDNSMCLADPPMLQYQVVDAQDATPDSARRVVTTGCTVRQIFTLADDCGNAQEVSYLSKKFPVDPAIDINIDGVAEGDAVPEAQVTYNIAAEADCLDFQSATIQREDDPAQVLIPGSIFNEPGDYLVTVTASVCGGMRVSETRRFNILDRPTAAIGGPYRVDQGQTVTLDARASTAPQQIGGIVRYEWDLDGDGFYDAREGTQAQVPFVASNGDGRFLVRVRVTAGNGAVAVAETTVTVDDVDPTCALTTESLRVPQGEAILFDADGTAAAHPDDPIIALDWYFENEPAPGITPEQSIFGQDFAYYVFETPGNYTVTLIGRDIDSECTASVDIVVFDVAPTITELEIYNEDGLFEGDRAFFSVVAAPGGNDPIVSVAWDFGDGSPLLEGPAERNPFHTYADQGTYTVTVTVVDSNNSMVEGTLEVTVGDLDPIVELDGETLGIEGDTLAFSAGNTRAGGAGDALRELRWSFGDGSPEVTRRPDQRDITHAFESDGEVEVCLTAEDEDEEVRACRRVTLFDVSPSADFEVQYPAGQQTAREGVAVRLDATNSLPGAPSDPVSLYRWDFGNGVVREGANLETIDYAWPDDGRYVVRLTIEDEDGSTDSAEIGVEVLNVDPVVELVLPEGSLEIGVSQTFSVVVRDVDEDVPVIAWDMGDGTTLNGPSVQHTYNRIQRFRIRVSVDDGDGGTAQVEANVDVTRALPRITAEARYEGVEGDELVAELQVSGAQQDDNSYDGPVQVPAPALPDGARFTLSEPVGPEGRRTARIQWTPSFVDAGEFTVRVRVLAPSGLVRERSFVLAVADAGTPFAAAASVVDGEGRVRLVEYGRDPNDQRLTFRPREEVRLENGVGGLAADPTGRFLFIASPGSGGVAVVDMSRTPLSSVHDRLVRTGPECVDVVSGVTDDGARRAWALNAGDGTLSIIDADRLKVLRTVALGALGRPTALVYLPAGAYGLAGSRLAITTARGEVRYVDVAAAERGQPAARGSRRVGGVLTHITADPDSQQVFIADAKTRRLYAFVAGALEADPAGFALAGTDLSFAPVSLAATAGQVYAATATGVASWTGEAGVAPVVDASAIGTALAIVPTEVYALGGLLMSSGNALRHVDEDLNEVLFANARRSRTLAAFVSRR